MDGLEACARMRQQPGGDATPIIMMTGLDDPQMIDRALQCGATDFQPKPVNWALLIHRLRFILRATTTTNDLRRSEAKVRALLSALPDLILQLDQHGQFVDIVQEGASGSLPTIDPAQYLGRHLSTLLPSDVTDLCMHFVRQALATGLIQVFEYQIDVDGQTRHCEARLVVVGSHQVLAIVRDVTDHKQLETQLEFGAHHDGLTKLPNRFLIRQRLNDFVTSAHKPVAQVGVVFVGLDQFQQINETFGYALGDVVLKHVATQLADRLEAENRILVSRTRHVSTMVGRFNADEFAILLPALTDGTVLDAIVDRLLGGIAAPLTLQGQELFLTASTGVSVFPRDGSDADTLLQNAEAAMHEAKRAGRNSRRRYEPTITAEAGISLSLESELRRAIERDEFRPFYQPKLDLRTGNICGAEALIRWLHPLRGVVLPAGFLRTLEVMGLSIETGDRLMRMIFRDFTERFNTPDLAIPIAVNVSDTEFNQAGLVDRIRRASDDWEFPLDRLEIEVTEQVLVSDRSTAERVLDELRQLGVRIAVDDFGTGYSSLGQLMTMPVDTLKIDRSFIRALGVGAAGGTLTASIIEMGHRLGLTVVAEGVETEAQRHALESLGCDQLQGFLFARPADADKLGERLAAQHGQTVEAVRTTD